MGGSTSTKTGGNKLKTRIWILIVILCMLTSLLVFVLPWLLLALGTEFAPEPPVPEIIYGEFPFSVTYEINYEDKQINDSIICEFDGFDNLGNGGIRRKWKSRLKSGNKYLVLYREENEGLKLEIVMVAPGLPEYYMGDFAFRTREEHEEIMSFPNIIYRQWKNGTQTESIITKKEAWEKYHIKIINTEYSSPIENKFE